MCRRGRRCPVHGEDVAPTGRRRTPVVYYELGYAHGVGTTVTMFCWSPGKAPDFSSTSRQCASSTTAPSQIYARSSPRGSMSHWTWRTLRVQGEGDLSIADLSRHGGLEQACPRDLLAAHRECLPWVHGMTLSWSNYPHDIFIEQQHCLWERLTAPCR